MQSEQRADFLQYYHLESYLFNTVRPRFHAQGYLSATDFFCIVIWKANRAKSTTARRISNGFASLEDAVRTLTCSLANREIPKEQMRLLFDTSPWYFGLPMASAILSVLYPDVFTVYDVRVCEALRTLGEQAEFGKLANITNFERLWTEYESFITAVKAHTPSHLSLRDKDRYLWGKSFFQQLETDLQTGFAR